jgi:hypothetical protein
MSTAVAYSHFMARYWAVWASLALVLFLVPEFWMLIIGRPQDTLSANVWRAEQFLPGQAVMHWSAVHFLLIAVLIVLDVWLLGHFGWGLWT